MQHDITSFVANQGCHWLLNICAVIVQNFGHNVIKCRDTQGRLMQKIPFVCWLQMLLPWQLREPA